MKDGIQNTVCNNFSFKIKNLQENQNTHSGIHNLTKQVPYKWKSQQTFVQIWKRKAHSLRAYYKFPEAMDKIIQIFYEKDRK